MIMQSAETQLDEFIDKFDQANQALSDPSETPSGSGCQPPTSSSTTTTNFFVIGYGPTERPSDAIISIAAAANGVGLCFIHGASLPDPHKLLQGSGNQTRFIRLDPPQGLDRPELEDLLAKRSPGRSPCPKTGQGKLIIRSISEKQRPRRKATLTGTT